MPGGKLDEDDVDMLHCASRETLEECGIAISPSAWEMVATSTLSVPGKTFVLVLCATKLEAYPTNFDAESLGIEIVELFSEFKPLGGNECLFEAMKEYYRKDEQYVVPRAKRNKGA